MEAYIPLVVQAIAGLTSSNVVGALLRQANTSLITRSLAGVAGGLGGARLLDLVGLAEPFAQMLGGGAYGPLVAQTIAALVGGGALQALLGLVPARK